MAVTKSGIPLRACIVIISFKYISLSNNYSQREVKHYILSTSIYTLTIPSAIMFST